ncbi:hypothetical protein Nmel_008468 [Mimus melanotis]
MNTNRNTAFLFSHSQNHVGYLW